MDRNSKIYTDGCVDATFSFFLKEDNLILLICIGGAMVLLQVSMRSNFIVFLKTAFMQIFKKFVLQMIEEKHFSVLVKNLYLWPVLGWFLATAADLHFP